MKKEIGKWLMDIAKYMTTAILLSSLFGEMNYWWMYLMVFVLSVASLFLGVQLYVKGNINFRRRRNNNN